MNSLLSGLRSSLTSAGKLNSSSHIPVMEIKACIYEERGFFPCSFFIFFHIRNLGQNYDIYATLYSQCLHHCLYVLLLIRKSLSPKEMNLKCCIWLI